MQGDRKVNRKDRYIETETEGHYRERKKWRMEMKKSKSKIILKLI